MKFKSIVVLCLLAGLFYACGNTGGETPTPDPDITETPDTPQPDEPQPDPAPTPDSSLGGDDASSSDNWRIAEKDKKELAYLQSFLPDGLDVMDFEYGDLNKDDRTDDVILIGYDKKKEEDDMSADPPARPLLILTRTEDGKLKKEASNDKSVLCVSCGGVMGDPYQDIAIKNGYFSVEHYGGSSWRWTRIVTYKYDEAKKGWFLHKDGGTSFHASEPDKAEDNVRTTKDFGVVKFADFDIDKDQ